MVRKIFIIGGIIVALIISLMIILRTYTKSFSPNEVIQLTNSGTTIEIDYSRPYKKGRKIFGELVPYGVVWRTGANEPTTFTTSADLYIKGKKLPAGTYSLWTVPKPEIWEVIWNNEVPNWGIDPFNEGRANRNLENDVLSIEAPVIESSKTFEQLTIELRNASDDVHMTIMWDQTMIMIPMSLTPSE